MNRLRLFIRHPFTQSTNDLTICETNKIITYLIDYKKYPMDILPYKSISKSNNFKEIFEKNTGNQFTPDNFRNYRFS